MSFPTCFSLCVKLDMLLTLTVIPSQLLDEVLHSTQDASFKHPLSVGMIFLVELWNTWSFKNKKFVLKRFIGYTYLNEVLSHITF